MKNSKETLTAYLNGQVAEEFDNRIYKLVKRYNKCLDLYGNYVEKYFKVQTC